MEVVRDDPADMVDVAVVAPWVPLLRLSAWFAIRQRGFKRDTTVVSPWEPLLRRPQEAQVRVLLDGPGRSSCQHVDVVGRWLCVV